MDRRAEYQPPFERYFIHDLAQHSRLANQVPEALQLLQKFYIQRYLRGSQVLQTGRDLLRAWARNPEAKVIEARATLGPVTDEHEYVRRQQSDVSFHPAHLNREIQMRMRYQAYRRDSYPNPDLETLSFAWSQDQQKRKTELSFVEGTQVKVDLSGESFRLDDFNAMADLAKSINFFSAEVFSRTRRVREDYSLARDPGLVVNFSLNRAQTTSQAA